MPDQVTNRMSIPERLYARISASRITWGVLPWCIVFLASILNIGCSSTPAPFSVPITLQSNAFTHAIYNSDNKLISLPIEELKQDFLLAEKKGNPFTDVIVVAHGWNYTQQEAIANYYKYISEFEKLEHFERTKGRISDKRVYFIFVVWSSVTRPITEAAKSILPYGLEQILAPATKLVDAVFFHIPSNWKETLDAEKVGIGDSPCYNNLIEPCQKRIFGKDRYVDWNTENFQYFHGNVPSRNLPISALLYEAIKYKHEKERVGSGFSIHLVGHSYGSKLLALAAIHAVDNFPSVNQKATIDSLVMVNAAFHPLELDLLSRRWRATNTLETSLLEIPRKVFLYTHWDSANSHVFDLSQFVFNNANASFTNSALEDLRTMGGVYGFIADLGGAPQFAYNLGTSAAQYILAKTLLMPSDFYHHMKSNDTLGDIHPIIRIPFNGIHYFAPIDKLLPGKNPTERGFFRPTFPAIGSVGLQGISEGRDSSELAALISTGNLSESVFDDSLISAKTVDSWLQNKALPTQLIDFKPDIIYSIDMSKIYDSWWPPFVGAHGDLGKESTDSDSSKIAITTKLLGGLLLSTKPYALRKGVLQ